MAVIAYMIGEHRVLIDEEFLPLIQAHRWFIDARGYAVRYAKLNKKKIPISLHREIMRPEKYLSVDHINGNPSDNRVINLRICSHHQNTMNQLKRKTSVSKYKGVTPCKRSNGKLWIAQIAPNGKRMFLGRFSSEEEAAKAYDEQAKIHYVEFAKLNFPRTPDNEIKISETYYQPDYRSLTSSKYKGVRLMRGKWFARVSCKDREIYLKSHKTEEDAARAHDKKSWGNLSRSQEA